MTEYHRPVLIDETITLLNPKLGGVFLDATIGGGSDAAAILEKIGPTGRLIGIDRDPDAIEFARQRLREFGDNATLIQGNFGELAEILASLGVSRLDGALFDLGVSSHQLDAARGFSFSRDEPLDMRMSTQEDTPTARDIVNSYSEQELADLIRRYGEERYSRRIAGAIVERRANAPIETTGELADIVVHAVPAKSRWRQDIHPATRSFQAIRIQVNNELEAVERGISAAIEALGPGARICVISFHSLEDRIVKQTFRRYAGHCQCPPKLPACVCGAKKLIRTVTAKPVTPSVDEIIDNPRSRSSKLRCAERVDSRESGVDSR